MEKNYDPHKIENNWYEFWEKNGFFSPSGKGNPYCIMIPPPNVTGSLHMGHAFQQAIMDALTRYHRMAGCNTLWQAGVDHAGIATQMVVERKLENEEQKSRYDLGREAFVKKIWEWKTSSGDNITRQMRRLGNSVDWDTERFTMDEGMTKAVKTAFIKLYEEGLAYRGKRLVNWDPNLQTAISDLEVENRDKQGHLWYFRYPLTGGATTKDGKPYLVVATTRPETFLGDSAVAVHPDDERYQGLVGHTVALPLTGRTIPVIADDYVDPGFGTGCVKITPAHDFNDYEMGKRHQLPLVNIMTKTAVIADKAQVFNIDGSLNHEIKQDLPSVFSGLDRLEARKAIIATFEQEGLLEKIDDHALKVPYGDRSGVVIEPLLTDQWFIKTAPLAAPAIKAVEEGKVKFIPQQYENMYFSWMRDIQDWCISRQLWWGHRIPVWYDKSGKVYVAENETAVREKYQLDEAVELQQDEDVFDTWFSSALWTFATLGWPEKTGALETFHPTDVLVTGFDIIFFWVARMMMMTMHFIKDKDGTPQVPFKHVYMHGLIRDEQGQKMSKTKGNVLDPLDMIDGIGLESLVKKRTVSMMQPQMAEKIGKRTRKQFPEGIAAHGADALRYTLYSLASTGRNINWDMKRLEGYRNFCNKLWNASRYVFMNTQGHDCGQDNKNLELGVADRWILSRLQKMIESVRGAIAEFRMDHATQAIYEFIWNAYCDWYLELSKPVLWDEKASDARLRGTRHTLVYVLECALRVAHPFIPFITEEIWQKTKPLLDIRGESLMLQSYPVSSPDLFDNQAENTIAWLQGVVGAVRQIRHDMNIAPGKTLELIVKNPSNEDKTHLAACETLLMKIARVSEVKTDTENRQNTLCANALAGTLEIMVPMASFIDKEAEIARLAKEISRLENETARLSGKLSNSVFTKKAPAAVIEKEKTKLQEASIALEKLKHRQKEIMVL